jgi:hypothetical protein
MPRGLIDQSISLLFDPLFGALFGSVPKVLMDEPFSCGRSLAAMVRVKSGKAKDDQ